MRSSVLRETKGKIRIIENLRPRKNCMRMLVVL